MNDNPSKLAIGALSAEIAACRICRDSPAPGRAPLPHEPRPVCVLSPTARIVIAGQAPGTRVHQSGIPFNDPSGDRLRDWMGIGREVFYDAARVAIVPMGFCFPGLDPTGSDLPPRRECMAAWHDRIFAAMAQAELLLVVGQYAHRYHLGPRRRGSLSETVFAWREIVGEAGLPKMLPLPHPSWRNSSWLKKNPWFIAELLPYLRAEVARLI